jgi:hypothetical protein
MANGNKLIPAVTARFDMDKHISKAIRYGGGAIFVDSETGRHQSLDSNDLFAEPKKEGVGFYPYWPQKRTLISECVGLVVLEMRGAL